VLSQLGRLIHLNPKLLSAGLLLSLGFLVSGLYSVSAQHAGNQADSGLHTSASTVAPSRTASERSLRNGVYLYGESAKPEQIRQEYFVFELQGNQVTGAFYMPYSSFDCFQGSLKEGKLDLTILNSYEEGTYSHSVRLQDYQAVPLMSQKDQGILSACKSVQQAKVRHY